MAAIGIVTAATRTVIAAIRKAKTALGALAAGTIAMGITAVLVSIEGDLGLQQDLHKAPTVYSMRLPVASKYRVYSCRLKSNISVIPQNVIVEGKNTDTSKILT